MTSYVLVHGSWHGGWAWEPVGHRLSDRGLAWTAPTLAGHGPGARHAGVRHRDCVDSVVRHVTERELSDIVLVGHSFGGSVIAKVAERIPDRIGRLVFFTAFVPADGESVLDNLPPDQREQFASAAAQSPENVVLCPWEAFRDFFMQDAPPDAAREVWERLCPQPFATWSDPLDLGTFYRLEIPRAFVACRDDRALPDGWWHPKMASRLGEYDLLEMPGGHEAMFTRPDDVADRLIAAGAAG